jgi:hypothetical protein
MHITENARITSGTRTRVSDVSPLSGMCPLCIEECPMLCEVGKSAFRGREVLYPSSEYFGVSTAASNKDFMLDWSHFQILSDLLGAWGIEPSPDKAFFENVDISTSVANHSKKPIRLKVPLMIAGLGSTAVAKKNWDGLAKGAALAGTIQVIGENVCGMDPDASYSNGMIKASPDLAWRIKTYRELWDGENGNIAVQTNVEDQRAAVDDYAMSKLEVDIIERKWGQGAKSIGGWSDWAPSRERWSWRGEGTSYCLTRRTRWSRKSSGRAPSRRLRGTAASVSQTRSHSSRMWNPFGKRERSTSS